MRLVTLSRAYPDAYRAALETGWTPPTTRPEAAAEELRPISSDPDEFTTSLDDPDARGHEIRLPDGSFTKRPPGLRRWIWDDGFCGSTELRWQHGTNALAVTCLGHVGYAVVPWRRRGGLATAALAALLPEARRIGLTAADLSVDPSNIASIGVIEVNSGRLVSRREKIPSHGDGQKLLYRIVLSE